MNDFRIDSHKLLFHPRRVADWLEGKPIAPLYLEVSPSGMCNHRCRFCGMDYVGYPKRRLPGDLFRARLAEMGEAGVRAIMFAGEGEPFMNREMESIAIAAREAGIDVAFTTNGVLLAPHRAEAVLPVASWIKVSCNAGTAATYAHVHGTSRDDFDIMWRNMEAACALRAKSGAPCVIGFQLLALPENRAEAAALAARARDIGADYLVIKPYSISPKSLHDEYRDLRYGACDDLLAALELGTDAFRVIFRQETMQRREQPRLTYARCQALPFWGYVDSGATLWGCLRHIGEEAFNFGNLADGPFADLLNHPNRMKKLKEWSESGEIGDCHVACRMDAVNAYLWELRNPSAHVNFI